MVVRIGYARVSRSDEIVENQIQAIKRFVGEDKEIKFFVDVGVSGAIPAKRRKGFAEMLRFIHEIRQQNKEEEINLYVYEISRIGRDMLDTVTMIRRLEKELNVRVFSVSEKEQFLNTQEETIRNLILTIFAWVAERERELIIQRTKEGLERARREGKHIGRPELQLTDRQMKRIKHYLELGISISDIAKLLGVNYKTLYGKLHRLGLVKRKKRRGKKEDTQLTQSEQSTQTQK